MLQRLQEAVAAIEAKLAATRLDIVRHDTRVELCDARIDGLRREAEMRADDLQDEEAEEAFVGRKLAREAAAGKPVREASR
jgi:chromosome segregation ATPase